ncbi:MAG: hypothetical protein ACP5HU_13060 [Phycisphaerae bacterium]
MAEWRKRADGFLPAVQQLLTPLDRRARSYPHPNGGYPLKLVHHKDGTIVAVDDADWQNRLELGPDDIVLHQLDLRLLRKTLCDALNGVSIAKTPVDQSGRCLQLGNWEPKKAASFPVFLLLCPNRKTLREQVLELQHRNRRPGAILLTPSRVNWTDATESTGREGNMLLVTLSEVVSFEDDRLVETESWEEYLQAFAQMVKLTLPSNYRNRKPTPMRAERTAAIEKLEKELEAHLLAARGHAHSLNDLGLTPELLPRPLQKDLANRAGLTTSQVCNCLKDSRARMLKILWESANSLDAVMNYQRRR